MHGKTCVVTGANAGIGRATALALARRGAVVALVCRDGERGEAVRREIAAESGAERAALFVADLGVRREVRDLAARLIDRFSSIDVLLNNAGIYTRRRRLTADGLETQFAVNHLAPFLLTSLLLPRLEPGARVVTVSSEAHRGGRIEFDDLQGERSYSGLRAYRQSKLANLLFTRELAARLEGSGVTANACHPGVVSTRLLFNAFPPFRILKPFMKTPEQGARTSLFLACSPDVAGSSGRYFIDETETSPSPVAVDSDLARRLWEVSLGLVADRTESEV